MPPQMTRIEELEAAEVERQHEFTEAVKEAVVCLNKVIRKTGQTEQRLFLELVRDDWLRELPELRRRYLRRMSRIIEVLRAHAAD